MDLANHLDKLRSFQVIAESRTMSEAAQRLNISQPSLTKLVQTLEAVIGSQLLIRGRHGVLPTEAGKELLAYAHSILNQLGDLEQRLRHPSDKIAGHLRVGAYASLGEYLWPAFIPVFGKKWPQLRLSIHSAESLSHTETLASGKIDILIDAEPRLIGEFMSWNLYEDRFNFFANKMQPEFAVDKEIVDFPLIYSPNAFDGANKRITQHLEEHGYHFKQRIEFDSFMAVKAFAKSGSGVAVLPNRLAESDVRSGHLKPISLKGFSARGFGSHHFAASILETRKDDIRLKTLIQALREWFKN
jgi:LysR family hydrogen peroxide-inducible transcriptional activator